MQLLTWSLLSWSLSGWTACSPGVPTPPDTVPASARVLWVDDGYRIHLGNEDLLHWSTIAEEPTEPVQETLASALAVAHDQPLWVSLPAETAFWGVRRVLGSAKESGTASVFLSESGGREAFAVHAQPKYQFAVSCDAPQPVKGVDVLLTLSLQGGPEQAWVIGSARFVPVTDNGPVDGLPDECFAVPPCEELFPEGPLRTACSEQQGKPAPGRVTFGGERGCLLPIAKSPPEAALWRPALAKLIPTLGLVDRPMLVVMPEATVRLDALLPLLGAFADAGSAVPAIGVSALVEGNDGPPVCNATIHSADDLALASARWLGAKRLPAEASGEPAPANEITTP